MTGGGGGSGGGGGGLGAQLGGIVGGFVGQDQASGDRTKAQGYAEAAFNELLALGLPPDLSKEVIMQKFQQAGIMSPEMEQAINQTHSKVSEMQEDPATREAQMGALNQLRKLGQSGLGAQDRAGLNQVRDQVQRDLEAKRQQILQNQQARGMSGSGAELIAQLQGAQGGANQASMEGDRLAGMAQQRALQAISQGANLAGGIRGQDYQTAMNRASAEDQMNRFNTENQIARQQRNAGARNLAQAQNLSAKQRTQDMNTTQANNELLRQNEAKRDYWNDVNTRAKIRSGANQNLGGIYQNRGDALAKQNQDRYTAIGGFLEDAVKAVYTMGGSEMMGGGGQKTAGGGDDLTGGSGKSFDPNEWKKYYA